MQKKKYKKAIWEERVKRLPPLPSKPVPTLVLVSDEVVGYERTISDCLAEYEDRKDHLSEGHERNFPLHLITRVCSCGYTLVEKVHEGQISWDPSTSPRICPACKEKYITAKEECDRKTIALFPEIVQKIHESGIIDGGEGLRDTPSEIAWGVRQTIKEKGYSWMKNIYE